MEQYTAKILMELNNRFYQQVAESFSDTRQHPWPGWDIIADCIENDLPGKCLSCPKLVSCNHAPEDATSVSVLDLACGNLRFESYLEQRLPDLHFDFHAVDNCDVFPETPVKSHVQFQQADLIESLLDENASFTLDTPPCHVAVSFGFMHHIPGHKRRARYLRHMLNMVIPGGLVCVSFWNFMQDPKMARKAIDTHERAVQEIEIEGLEDGDYIIGWQGMEGVYRYCHSFNEDEIDSLAECIEPESRIIRRFHADGRNNKLNTYLVFQRN